jgi:pimeloyl-ACP methyl ester carboxylesterase
MPEENAFSGRFVESARGRTHYWIHWAEPGARCVVFTHGLTANHEMFEPQAEYFRQKYTLILWDVPLHGMSRPYRDFSYENAAEELDAILRQEGIGRAALVGMSMGGYPCQMFALKHPEKVECFVALDTTPFGPYYSASDQFWLRQAGRMANWYPDGLLRRSMARSVSRTEWGRAMMLRMLGPLSKADIARQMDAAYGKFLQENRDASFDFPVLILLGERDRTGKVSEYCRAWAKKTGYPLHIIPGAAHLSNVDNPDAVNREIESFLQALDGPGKRSGE